MGHMGYRADAYWEICCSRFRFKGISKWIDAHPDLIPTGGTDLTAARRAIDARRLYRHERDVFPPTHRDVSLV
jgi:hypothetical protein